MTNTREDQRIRAALGALKERLAPPPTFEQLSLDADHTAPDHAHRPARWAVAAAITAVAGLAVGGVVWLRSGDDTTDDPAVIDERPTPITSTTGPTATEPAPAPIEEGWMRLARAPLTPRISASSAWTGDEIVVFGGGGKEFQCPREATCADPDVQPFRDGAAIDMGTQQWRPIADAPVGLYGAQSVVVDGDVYVLARKPSRFLRYDPTADRWQTLPSIEDDGQWELLAAPGGVIAYAVGSVTDRSAWMYTPNDRRWTRLPDDPLSGAEAERTMLSTQTVLLLFVTLQGGATPRVVGARYDLTTGEWAELPTGNATGLGAWLADDQVLLNPIIDPDGRNSILDLATNSWSELPPPPDDPVYFSYSLAGAVGEHTADYGYSDQWSSWILDVTDRSWVKIPPVPDTGSSGLRLSNGTTAVGRSMFVFGGQRWETVDDLSTGRLLDDAWLWTPPAAGTTPSSVPSASQPYDPDQAAQAAEQQRKQDQAQADEEAAATDPTPASVLAPPASPPPIAYNELERKVIRSLASLGIEADTGDHSLQGADMWAEFDDGSALYVSAHPPETPIGDGSVIGERTINGVVVERFEYFSGLVKDSFVCDGTRYDAHGAVPPGFEDFDAFLTSFIAAVGC